MNKTAAALLAGLLLCMEVSAHAATFTVTTTSDSVDVRVGDGIAADPIGRTTLRAAIMEANALPGHDTIVLPAGVYKTTIPGLWDEASKSGDLDVTSEVTLLGAGAATTIVDADRLEYCFHVLAPGIVHASGITFTRGGPFTVTAATVTLTDCIIRENNGFGGFIAGENYSAARTFPEYPPVNLRGGIFNLGGRIYLNRCQILSNAGNPNICENTGSGITSLGGSIDIDRSIISDNLNPRQGGGILNIDGIITARDTWIVNNRTGCFGITYNVGGEGAGIYNGTFNYHGGTITLLRCRISENKATSYCVGGYCQYSYNGGGGIYHRAGHLIVQDCIFDFNYHSDALVVLARSTISNSLFFKNNDCALLASVPVTLTNCTFAANDGSPIESFADLTLINCTIVNNRSGIVNYGDTRMGNSICFNNGAFYEFDILHDFTSLGHNIIGNLRPGADVLRTDLIRIDPKLGPLQDNGGPTFTHALLPGSLAIDRGDNALAPLTDQRGIPRPIDGNVDLQPVADIGAYQDQPNGSEPRLIPYLLGLENSSAGLDFNADGQVDLADWLYKQIHDLE